MEAQVRTPKDAVREAVVAFEGLFQADPEDDANYVYLQDGTPKLVGTMRGVGAATFCNFTGIRPEVVTAEMMQSMVTLEMATTIGEMKVYNGMAIVKLAQHPYGSWDPCVEVVLDYTWGSGYIGIGKVQEMLGFGGKGVDGIIGINTQAFWKRWYTNVPDIKKRLIMLCMTRVTHYNDIGRRLPDKAKYVDGWKRRANSYLPDTPWFDKWR